jgi:hypothetical protein
MKTFFILILTLTTLSARASDDSREVCYNWDHERIPCNRMPLRRETYLGVVGTSYYGDHEASFSGSYGAGAILSTTKSYDTVRFMFGGEVLYSGANMYVNDVTYSTTMMAADLMFGLSIKPYRASNVQPVIEIDIMGGIKSFEVSNPPTTIENKTLVPSFAGKISLGVDLKWWRFTALRPAIEYKYNRVSGVIDGETLNLDTLGFSLGLVFF